MKKILAAILAAMMLMSTAVACTDVTDDPNNDQTQDETQTPDDGKTEDEGKTEGDGVIAPTVEAGTLGETMWNAFQDAITANAVATVGEKVYFDLQKALDEVAGGGTVTAGQISSFR